MVAGEIMEVIHLPLLADRWSHCEDSLDAGSACRKREDQKSSSSMRTDLRSDRHIEIAEAISNRGVFTYLRVGKFVLRLAGVSTYLSICACFMTMK